VLLFWDLGLKMSEGSKEWQALPDCELLPQWPWGSRAMVLSGFVVLRCDVSVDFSRLFCWVRQRLKPDGWSG